MVGKKKTCNGVILLNISQKYFLISPLIIAGVRVLLPLIIIVLHGHVDEMMSGVGLINMEYIFGQYKIVVLL
jgi:hypothetical protein